MNIVDDLMIEPKLEASVGMSRKWSAREAGREVAETAIKNLSEPPSFFLLFSTIHYEKYGGFQEFLNGVWDVLPEGTPLIGGTFGGFINNYGCYTRGSTALAVSYQNMDVAIGYGKNTKRRPKKAATSCAKMIKNSLSNTKWENNFILSIISGTTVPEIPGVGNNPIINSKITAKFITKGINILGSLLQQGMGQEEKILERLIHIIPDYNLLHWSAMDDVRMARNYQFVNKNVLKNSIVCIGVNTDININAAFSHGLKPYIDCKVTKVSKDRQILQKINGKPAASEFLRLIDQTEDFFRRDLFTKNFPYFPLGFYDRGAIYPRPFMMVLKDSLLLMSGIRKDSAVILTANGKDMINAAEDSIKATNYNFNEGFFLMSSCAVRLMTLGRNIFEVREKIQNCIKDKPFILVDATGEGIYKPNEELNYLNESIASMVFWR